MTSEGRTNLITPEGYRKIVDEINYLTKEERPRIVVEVTFAARQGDRSENAEYQYGKKRLREIDRRLRFLEKRAENAQIIDPREQRGAKIQFGATVQLETEDGKKVVYQIVGEDEADLATKRISWKSPVGKGLLNRIAGEWIEVETPGGTRVFQIISFEFK
jgi:transcription elongation factor GreB